MSDISNRSPLAPTALPPSVQSSTYERKIAPDMPGGRGPLRFEEGIATDSAVPSDFVTGMIQGYATDSRGHNKSVYIKSAQETMQDRLHPGSAAWTDAPRHLAAFAEGSGDEAEQNYIQVSNSGGRQALRNAAVVLD